MQLSPDACLAEIACRYPESLELLEQHRIDYCIDGNRRLAAACRERGLDPEVLLAEIARRIAEEAAAEPDWSAVPLVELMDHIVARHHDLARLELPRLVGLARAPAASRGGALVRLAEGLQELAPHFVVHLDKEEGVLFPGLERLETGRMDRPPCLSGPLRLLEEDHRQVAGRLADLGAAAEALGCPGADDPALAPLRQGLERLRMDTNRHFHLENNILFPRALRLAATR